MECVSLSNTLISFATLKQVGESAFDQVVLSKPCQAKALPQSFAQLSSIFTMQGFFNGIITCSS